MRMLLNNIPAGFLLLFFQTVLAQPTLKISFQPSDSSFSSAAREYHQIWKEDAGRVVEVMERTSGLKFSDSVIVAFVAELPSSSGNAPSEPMMLRASYSNMMKRATVVHELGHRLLFTLKKLPPNFNEHEVLFLFLFDAWVELFGEQHAKKMVEVESTRINPSNNYKKMWEDALSLSLPQRKQLLKELLNAYR